jgi:hypothetical protein
MNMHILIKNRSMARGAGRPAGIWSARPPSAGPTPLWQPCHSGAEMAHFAGGPDAGPAPALSCPQGIENIERSL